MRRKRWIRVVVLTMTAAAPVIDGAFTFAADSLVPTVDDTSSVNHLISVLKASTNSTVESDQAAVKLVARTTADARAVTLDVLKNGGSAAQVAIAKAIAQTPNPDPNCIPGLGDLLGASPTLTEAAASGLANYGDDPQAFQRLSAFGGETRKSIRLRSYAITAIGSQTQLPAAEFLAGLLTNPSQGAIIQNAATDALHEMTGLNYGSDVPRWRQWWIDNRGKTQDQFRAQLLVNRARLFNLANQREAQQVDQINQLLRRDYKLIPEARRTDVLLSYLNNRAPEIRVVGLAIADSDFSTLADAVREQLKVMIGDPDNTVRMQAVMTQMDINNHSALSQLINQVKVETDDGIKVKLATALGRVEDPAAAPALLQLLHDPKLEVVASAARALAAQDGHFGERLRQADANEANLISNELRGVMATHANQPGADDFRAACLSALAALRDPQSFDTFKESLRPDETSDVRRAAIRGLGNLGNTNADVIVANQLEDPDRTIRLEAALALESVATPEQAVQLFDRMKTDGEKDVRDALWEAFRRLYAKENPAELQQWADQFKSSNDPDAPARRLATLQKRGELLEQIKPSPDQEVAENQQSIADAMIAVNPPQNAEAIKMLQKALEYWRGPGKGNGDQIETLIGQLLDLQLNSGNYADATAFAARQIALNSIYQEAVGPLIKNKADALSGTNPKAAAQLITEALKMSPPLENKYVRQLQQTQADLPAQSPGP